MELGRLSEQDGVALLADRCGARRIHAEQGAAGQLVGLCAGLPLALQLAAARLRNDRRLTVGDLVGELTEERRRLAGVAIGPELVVAAVVAAAYRNLPESAAQLYRSLGELPGPDFTLDVAAAVAGVGVGWARGDLTILVDHRLVESDGAGRYRFQPLVRLHVVRIIADAGRRPSGRKLGRAPRPPVTDEPGTGLRRAVEFYLSRAIQADRVVMGARMRLTHFPAEHPGPFADGVAGLTWLTRERANLMAALRAAAGRGWSDLVWQLAETMTALFFSHRHLADWYESGVRGAAAARVCARADAEARLWALTSRVMLDLGRTEEAGVALDRALLLAESLGQQALLGSVWEFRGRYFERTDRPAAIAAYQQAIEYQVAAGERRGAAVARFFLGQGLEAQGHHDEAIAELTEAYEALIGLRDQRLAARVQAALGIAHAQLGEDQKASKLLSEAVEIMARRHLLHYEGEALEALAEVRERLADRFGARECLQRALEIQVLFDSPRAPALQARLQSLGD